MAEPPQLSVKREFNMNKPHAVPKERNSIGGKGVYLCVRKRKRETKKEREKEKERGQLSGKYELNMNQPHPISMERNSKKVRF